MIANEVINKSNNEDVLVNVNELKKYFPIHGGLFRKVIGYVKAVDGVSFNIRKGETFGLVGESGCGKTTLGKCIINLIEPTSGDVTFEGVNISKQNKEYIRKWRENAQIVFQDPFSSLDPRKKIGELVGEPLIVHGICRSKELNDNIKHLLEVVNLSEADMERYPHEFSGGQRQRIGVARALALNPKLIICDEPVSALDVSIQSQVLNLLKDLQKEFGLTYLFVAHGLPVIKYMCDRIGVMYLGKIVEMTDKDTLFNDFRHPYTKALLSAIPVPDPDIKKEVQILEGDVPSPANPPIGCRFHTRCPEAKHICEAQEPYLKEIEKDHYVACHFAKHF